MLHVLDPFGPRGLLRLCFDSCPSVSKSATSSSFPLSTILIGSSFSLRSPATLPLRLHPPASELMNRAWSRGRRRFHALVWVLIPDVLDVHESQQFSHISSPKSIILQELVRLVTVWSTLESQSRERQSLHLVHSGLLLIGVEYVHRVISL